MVLTAVTDPAELPRANAIAQHVSAALEAAGDVLVGPEHASAVLDSEMGRPFVDAPTEFAAHLTEVSQRVLDDVAFGRNQRAMDAGEPLLAEIDVHAAALSRAEGPSTIGNLCLFLVRAELQAHHADRARERARTCLRLVPDLAVDESLHPRSVRELLARVRQEIAAGGASSSSLSVQASATDPEGCAIRINGRVMGRTRGATVALPLGRYAVQVECGTDPGRVFAVELATPDPVPLAVPVELAAALTTDDGVALSYGSVGQLDAALARHVALIARALDVQRVLVVAIATGDVTVRAFERGEGMVASLSGTVPVVEPVDDAASRRVLDVAHGASPDASDGRDDGDEAAPSAAQADVGLAIAGGSVLGLGLLGMGMDWYLWSEARARGAAIPRAPTTGEFVAAQRSFDDWLPVVGLVGAVSGALATAAMPLVLPDEDGVPWWSWLVGGVGLAAVGVASYFFATDGECYGNTALMSACTRRAPNALAGALLLEQAAPLLAVPITYLIRAAIGPTQGGARAADTGASLDLGPSGGTLSVTGNF